MKRSLTQRLILLCLLLMLCLPGLTLAGEPLNINTANIEQLQTVTGIGPKMAEKIITYRQEHGAFAQVADLCQVKGIGEASLQKMSSQLCVK